MKKLIQTVLFVVIGLASLASNMTMANPLMGCQGRFFNPITDANWNDMFPISVAGVKMGTNIDPPWMYVPPLCVCPGIFGIPSPGIGITFWEPLYVVEIEKSPGCLSTLGGIQILPNYAQLGSEKVNVDSGGHTNRMQVHEYQYPIFAMLDIIKGLACKTTSGFQVAWITEPDFLWQGGPWSAVLSPEAALFSNPLAQAACGADAAATEAAFPIDFLFWCAGQWGSTYPLDGNAQNGNSDWTTNGQVLSKFLARQMRLGLIWQTIGPTAICFSHPNPVWIKSQFKVNQIFPVPLKGRSVTIGRSQYQTLPGVTNYPTHESSAYLIWQGQQCCARLY